MPRTCTKRLLEAPVDQLTLGAKPSSSSTWRAARSAADSPPSTVTLPASSINAVPWKVAVTMISSSTACSAAVALELSSAISRAVEMGGGWFGDIPSPYAGINRIRFNGFSRAGPSGLAISGDAPPQRTQAV